MPLTNEISFKAKALNGTPPITFSWNFGDGSPLESGEMVKHTYKALGKYDTIVTGTDASGTHSFVQLTLMVVKPAEWADRLGLDPNVVANYPSPAPDPDPSVTP